MSEAAKTVPKAGGQEPFANFTKATGVVFPNRRLEWRRHTFLKHVLELARKLEPTSPKTMIEYLLRDLLDKEKMDPAYLEFYDAFEEGARWSASGEDRERYTRQLLRKFNEAWSRRSSSGGVGGVRSGTIRPAVGVAPGLTKVALGTDGTVGAGPSDQSIRVSEAAADVSSRGSAPMAAPAAAPPGAADEPRPVVVGLSPSTTEPGAARSSATGSVFSGTKDRALFNQNDADYILEGLTDLESSFAGDEVLLDDGCREAYDRIFHVLGNTLTKTSGVSAREFTGILLKIKKQPPPKWDQMGALITARFNERWQVATAPAGMSPLELRNFRG